MDNPFEGMTREEAIECLNFQNEKFFGGQSEALKMAIKALSVPEREKGYRYMFDNYDDAWGDIVLSN